MSLSLFSIFDPSYHLGLSPFLMNFWLVTFLVLNQSFSQGGYQITMNSSWGLINASIKPNLSYSREYMTILLGLLFLLILSVNISGNLPYNMAGTALPLMAVSWGLVLISVGILMSWSMSTKKFLSHLVPAGSPSVIMLLLVIIELVSLIIRPITLSIRLTANLMAGHILPALLFKGASQSWLVTLMVFWPSILIYTLELGVALIQAFVFTVLLSLYSMDSH